MLLTVEGGGFFSSSASGYSKFLTLFLCGRKDEERPMRVLPWNRYQLVEQELDTDIQLAPTKNEPLRRCTFFICFRHSSAALDGSSLPNVGPLHSDLLADSTSVLDKERNYTTSDTSDESGRRMLLKSSLKKHTSESSTILFEERIANETSSELECDITRNVRGRKIQWTDYCGRELAEIREFEPSTEEGITDEESEHESSQRCKCVIQ